MSQRTECDEILLKCFQDLQKEVEKAKEPEIKGKLIVYMLEIYKTLFS